MLQINVPESEFFDDDSEKFVNVEACTLHLEHSLVSLSKWESRWEKAFLSKEDKTPIQTLDYVRAMTLDENIDPAVYLTLGESDLERITKYIAAPMTATWFNEKKHAGPSREVVTAELIYYWMIAMTIPFECQHWHLNRLLTLIRVCEAKNNNGKEQKLRGRDLAAENRALNQARRKKLGTTG